MRKIKIVAAALLMLLVLAPATAGAQNDRQASDVAGEHSAVEEAKAPAVQRPVTVLPDVAQRPVRRCVDFADNRRRCVNHAEPSDRCEALVGAEATDRCDEDFHIDLDDPAQVRHLIQRLINTGNWQLLIRLLSAIGLI